MDLRAASENGCEEEITESEMIERVLAFLEGSKEEGVGWTPPRWKLVVPKKAIFAGCF